MSSLSQSLNILTMELRQVPRVSTNLHKSSRNVLFLKPKDVTTRNGEVFTPILMELSKLRRSEQFKKDLVFSDNMSKNDVKGILEEAFPELINKRFSCAARENKDSSKLVFHGDRRVWDGITIRRKLRGASAMYIVLEDETSQVSGSATITSGGSTGAAVSGNHNQSNPVDTATVTDAVPRDLKDVNPGRFDMDWKDVMDVLEEDVKKSEQMDSRRSETSQITPHFAVNQEQNKLYQVSVAAVQGSERSETGYSSAGSLSQDQGLNQAQDNVVTTDALGSYTVHRSVSAATTCEISQTGYSSEEASSSQDQEFVVTVDPNSGPTEGGKSFCLEFDRSLPYSVVSAWAYFGDNRTKVWKTYEGDCIMFGKNVPPGNPGPVTVKIRTETGTYLGETIYTYEDPGKKENEQNLSSKRKRQDMSDLFHKMVKAFKQLEKDDDSEENGILDSQQDRPNQEKELQPQEILKTLVYAAAEAGARDFVEIIFSLSAGRIVFEAYKNESSLPEDIAEDNGHKEIAEYLRDITKRYSEEDSTSPTQSKVIDCLELANAFEKIVLEESEPSSEDDISETGYSGDGETSSFGSERESSDSDEEYKRMIVCKGKTIPAVCNDRGILKKHVFCKSLIEAEKSIESSRILVTGLPVGTTTADLVIYFQSTRDSGGGVVKEIEIDGRQAVITFVDVQAASRIVGKGKHSLKNCQLIVSLLPEAAEFSNPEDEQDDRLNQLDGNCHGESLENDPPYTKTTQSTDARAELDRTTPTKQSETLPAQQRTVKVTGLLADTSEDLLTNYFENPRRSKGGPISSVHICCDLLECFITFESPDDAARTVENSPHKVGALCLDVSLLQEKEDTHLNTVDKQSVEEANITIIVSGTFPSKDALWNYFENERRSGGGEILEMDYPEGGDAVITFADVKDLKRLLEDPHSIDNKRITVVRCPSEKKVPQDPLKVHVHGLNETTSEDCLRFYLEKFSAAEVCKVYKGSNNNALAVFDVEPDFVALFDKVSKDRKGLEGNHVRLERVPICFCIEVKGLKQETSDDTIELYFENYRKSGGSRVNRVDRKEKDEVLVFFEAPSSVQSVIKRSHVLDRQTLDVKPHYPFLLDSTTNKTKVSFDAEVFNYIKVNHQDELQAVLDKQKVIVELSKDSQSSTITMFPSEKKNDSPQMWQERAGGLESFLKSFKRVEIQIGAELFDEITRRWGNDLNSAQRSSKYLVSFNVHGRCAQIIGREDNVDKENLRLRELIDAAQKDAELMKSIVEVEDTDIPKVRLTLLKTSGIGEKLQNEHQHLTILFDLKDDRLRLRGPRSVLQQVQLEIYKLTSKVIEKSIELSTNVIVVLKKPHVSYFTQSLLKEKEIQALFVYNHNKSSNEVLAVGFGQKSVTDAEKVMHDAILECSLRLSHENTLVLESGQWKDFHSNLTSNFKIGIFADRSSSTLWVCGIAEDVKICFDRIKHFFDVNTILHDSFPMDKGTTRFLFEKWGSMLDRIKKDLVACCLDLRVAPDCEGIEVSGTAEGVDKCMLKITELENAVQKDSVSVNKPGMKKFLLQDKGLKYLRVIEDRNRCVIIITARNEHEMSYIDVDDTGTTDVGITSAKFMCSYLTTEGKKVSVLKGDITKHDVDAIVNAANSQLKHIGGLALAIVRAGGQEIQSQCDEYIRERGDLLEGKTIETTAGALPCDKVIHMVVPKWDRWEIRESQEKIVKKKQLLKDTISNCLKTAKSSRSIAIPAVSSGVYGFPCDLCAEVILDAVLDFCTKNPSCTLSEIHLINNNDPTVMVFVKEMRKRFSKKTTFVDSEEPELAGSGLGTGSNVPKRRVKKKAQGQPTQGIHITVKVGDLAKEKADVLVGTAGRDLHLNQNPCARALSEAAGPTLQHQCTKRGAVAEGDIAVLSQTGNLDCRTVIFAVCCPWSSGRGEEVLKGILTKCLQEADKKNMTSIAFAAIGTGILQFPRDKVADIYFDEIMSFNKKHPNTSLKDVRFVLYDKDCPTIQAFQAAEEARQNGGAPTVAMTNAKKSNRRGKINSSSHGSLTFTPVKERAPDHLETTLGSLCFQAQPGDITKETTDAIAFISNCDLDILASRTGAAILRSGGDSIKKECSRKGLQTPGSVVVTKAGLLSARYLYHIVPTDHTPSGIKASLMQCLQEAENDRISSISFPAIGTGVIGMTAKSCAQVMLTAIQELQKNKPTSLKLIKMTIFQESMITDIRSAMEEASGMKPSQGTGGWQKAIRKGFKTVANAFGFGGGEESTLPESSQEVENRQIHLTIIAGCKKDLQEALEAVNEMMKETCKQKVIEHEAIASLTLEHMRRIHTLELLYSVELTVEKEVERIVLDGQYEDILQVFGDIHEILHEVKKDEHERRHAEVLSKDIQWKYEDKGKFEDYEGVTNAKIELAFQQKKKIAKITMDEEEYEINFDAMTQEDEYGTVSEIRRIDLRKDVEFPDCWVSQPTDTSGREETVHLFQLDPTKNAQEYKEVSDKFHQSCPNNIAKIERVQNPTLYGVYAINKQWMDKAGGEGSNELCLFHGTKGSNCELINHKGFNRSFCGENDVCYGNGVYFALQASYSARSTYSPPDSTGKRYMYLARVLVGEYTVGKQGIITPPAKNASNVTNTYDTVVDNVSNPGIYVVFYDWQCYPEYLITFQ